MSKKEEKFPYLKMMRYGDVSIDPKIRYRMPETDTVDRYVEFLKGGVELPAITVMQKVGKDEKGENETKFILINGGHTLKALGIYGQLPKANSDDEMGGLGIEKVEDVPVKCKVLKWDEKEAYALALMLDLEHGKPPTTKQIKERLRLLYNLDKKMYTQKTLATMFHVHQSQVSRWVNPPDQIIASVSGLQGAEQNAIVTGQGITVIPPHTQEGDKPETTKRGPRPRMLDLEHVPSLPEISEQSFKDQVEHTFRIIRHIGHTEHRIKLLDCLLKNPALNKELDEACNLLCAIRSQAKPVSTASGITKIKEAHERAKQRGLAV